MINYILLGLVILAGIIGMFMGFHKQLNFLTGGIFGVIISIVVCFMIGGTLQTLEFSQKLIAFVNEKSAEAWSFLQYLKLGYVAFYLVLFAIVQIARAILMSIIKSIASKDNGVIKFVDKSLGLIFGAAFFCAVILLLLAGVKMIENSSFGQTIMTYINDSYLKVIYENNPINFVA